MRAVFTVSGHKKAVTSALHLLILAFDKKRRIICPSQHTGTICSLMHIDVRIKANQAGRQASPLTIPPLPIPPCSHLFVPVLKHEHQPAQPTNPSSTQQRSRGHSLSLALAPQPPPPPLHPPSIYRRQIYPAECSHSGAYWFQNQCAAQLERGAAGCRLTNFCLEH